MRIAIASVMAMAVACVTSPAAVSKAVMPDCEAGQRAVTFNAEQLTINNVDVSPDGRRIAFDLIGDIYVVGIDGGEAVQLTRGMGWDVRPVWSPDGRHIAFISDISGSDQVHVVDVSGNGPVRQLSNSRAFQMRAAGGESMIGAAEWMPDSSAVVAQGVRFSIEGGSEVRLWGSPRRADYIHGNGVDLYRFRHKEEGVGFSILRMERGSAEWNDTRETLSTIAGQYEAPTLSPDGRWMVFRERAEDRGADPSDEHVHEATQVDVVRARDRRTGVSKVLLAPSIAPDWPDNARLEGVWMAANGRFSITPDSKYLIVPYGGKVHRINLETGSISPISITAKINQCLQPIARSQVKISEGPWFEVRNHRGARLRPDDKQLVFSALRRLYVVDTSSGEMKVLSSQAHGQFQPAYSPDGKWIAYASWNEAEGGYLWIVPSAGGTPQKLIQQPGIYQQPTWSHDGNSIAYVGLDDLNANRSGFHSNIQGGALRILSLKDHRIRTLPVKVRMGHPLAFTKDGRRIWYAPFDDQGNVRLHLSSIGIDGDGARRESVDGLLTNSTEERVLPSPDGRSIALIRSGDLHLIHCVDPMGAEDFRSGDCKVARITRDGAYDPHWRNGGNELEWSFADDHNRARTDHLTSWMSGGGKLDDLKHFVTSSKSRLMYPRSVGRGKVVLVGARVITMHGNEVIEHGFVRVEDGVITRVGDVGDLHVSDEDEVVDVAGKTLLPGFIDAHAHLTELPRDLLDANTGEALVQLSFGVTTAKDPSNGGDHAYTYSELVKAGDMIGPRLIGATAYLSRNQEIPSLDDAMGAVLRTKRLGGSFIKYHTGFDRDQRRWLMDAARANGLGVAAHWVVTNYIPGRLNLTTVIDGATTSEHGLNDGQEKYSDVVEFLAQSGVIANYSTIAGNGGYAQRFWKEVRDVPQMKSFYMGESPRERDLGNFKADEHGLPELAGGEERNAQMLAALDKSGGRVSIGSHGNFDGIGFHLEMWAHVRGGMDPHSVLRAATLTGAQAAGVQADLGSIEVGKVADLIVLDKNPLEDIRNTLTVERVMQSGILRDAMTLDEIWPERISLPQWRMPDKKLRVSGTSAHVEN